jgi:hypothetical protein
MEIGCKFLGKWLEIELFEAQMTRIVQKVKKSSGGASPGRKPDTS